MFKTIITPLLWATTLLSVGCFLNRCSQPSNVAGGSEIGNPVVSCLVVNHDGTPAIGATVRLRPAGYLTAIPSMAKKALFGADAITDEHGRFEISGVDTGHYLIEVIDRASHASFLKSVTIAVHDKVDLGTDTLHQFAIVKGIIDVSTASAVQRYVQVYGLDRLIAVDSIGRYTIGDLPQGVLTLRVSAADTLAVRPVIIDSVKTVAGMVTELPLVGWRFSKRLVLNTSATGANVKENVTNFPLLVRLDGSNFDFGQTRDSGQDLRITKADGSSLPFEIEQWDRTNAQAAMWVRMDTVKGNDTAQYLIMHWGNASASSVSSATRVFTAADGFAGVWHLGAGQSGDFVDASGNGNTGRAGGTLAPVRGIAGVAQLFHGGDTIICPDMPTLQLTDTIMISAWVKLADTTLNNYYRIVSKKQPWNGQNGYEMECNPGLPNFSIQNPDTGELTLVCSDSTIVRSNAHWDNDWHFCAVLKTGTIAQVVFDSTSYSSGPGLQVLIGNAPLFIGNGGPGNGMLGAIDEVRISRRARSASWIRLQYESQRLDQKLITLSP